MPRMRRSDASRAATASSATAASPRARRTRSSSSDRSGGTRSTSTCARGARSASSSAPATPSRWSPNPARRPELIQQGFSGRGGEHGRTAGNDHRRKRGDGARRLPPQRGLRHLPDHAVLAHGRARRPVVERGAREHLGQRPEVVEMQSEAGLPARSTAPCRRGR